MHVFICPYCYKLSYSAASIPNLVIRKCDCGREVVNLIWVKGTKLVGMERQPELPFVLDK
jgi:hypothetical protein